MMLDAVGADGNSITLWILDVKPDAVLVTSEHPLAGAVRDAAAARHVAQTRWRAAGAAAPASVHPRGARPIPPWRGRSGAGKGAARTSRAPGCAGSPGRGQGDDVATVARAAARTPRSARRGTPAARASPRPRAGSARRRATAPPRRAAPRCAGALSRFVSNSEYHSIGFWACVWRR